MTQEDVNEILNNGLAAYAKTFEGVREVGGNNKGEFVRMFQKAVDNVAGSEAWCFRGSHEILTDNGWVRLDELSDEKIAQVNDRHEMSFCKPIRKIEKQYKGRGYELTSQSLHLVCDENHRFYGKNIFEEKSEFEFFTLDQVNSCGFKSACLDQKNSGVNLKSEELSFLAAFLSDGFLHKTRQGKPRIRIQVSKERKVSELKKFNFTGFYTSSKCYGKSKVPLTTISFEVPQFFLEVFTEYKTLKWDFILSFSRDQASHFLKSYLIYDGYSRGLSNIISSSRKELADQILTLCLIAGYSPSMGFANSKLSGKPCYTITWCESKKGRSIRARNIVSIDLDEMLYCVEVPDGRIIVRGDSGTPLITGNCAGFSSYCIKTWGNVMKSAIDIPGFKYSSALVLSESVCNFWFNNPVSFRIDKPEVGSLILWRRWVDGKASLQDHIGIVVNIVTDDVVQTIEGNTSSDNSNERDGDGVFLKNRHIKRNYGSLRPLGFLKVF